MSELPETPQATTEEGVWFIFQEENHLIRVWGSLVSGKERIYVDDELIYEDRSFRRENYHEFSLGKHTYKVHIHTVSMLKGEMTCSLFRDGEIVKSYQLVIIKDKTHFGRNIAMFALIGAVLGGLIAFFELETWVAYIVIAVVLVYVMTRSSTMRLEVKEVNLL